MTWSNKTCHDPLEYTWVDKIKFIKPKEKDNQTFNMFDKESYPSNNKKLFNDQLMKCDEIKPNRLKQNQIKLNKIN